MLLEELAKKQTLNVDFHNHGQTGSELREQKGFLNKLWALLLSEGYSDLTGLLDRVWESTLDGLYITNFNDTRAEDWTSKEQIEKARKAGYQIEQGEYYTFFKKGNKVKFLGKSQEVPTTQGHVLFADIKRGKRFSSGKPLDESLEEANDGEIKNADHGECRIKGQHGVLAYSKNKEGDAKKFDCFGRDGNFYFPFTLADWRIIKSSIKYDKPLLYDSDGHHPKDIGNMYNIFETKYLNFSSEKAFRYSIKKSVIDRHFEGRFNPIPFYRIFHHMMMIVLNKIRDKVYHIKR